MRFCLVGIVVALAASLCSADVIIVPDPEEEIYSIQEGLDLAAAGDTVLVYPGTYDSVHFFETPLDRKSAICRVPDGVTLRGFDRVGVRLDIRNADYGVLFVNATSGSAIKNLTITGGSDKDRGLVDDAGGRALIAGIACLENASPLIRRVNIESGGSGILVRQDCAPTIENVLIARGGHHGVYVYYNGATPVTIDGSTIVDNFDNGVKVEMGSAVLTSSCITHSGKEGVYSNDSDVTVEDCNVFWNAFYRDPITDEWTTQDYGGDLSDLTGVAGNISAEPFYCDFTGSTGSYDYHVCVDSPNVITYPGALIGAFGAACADCVSPVARTSWGAIKSLYR